MCGVHALATSAFREFTDELRDKCRAPKPTLFHVLTDRVTREEILEHLFTQNIDGIEKKCEFMDDSDVTYPHGCLDTLVCTKDRCHGMPFDPPHSVVDECVRCLAPAAQASERRSRLAEQAGRLRPDIVLYGEGVADGLGIRVGWETNGDPGSTY